jgi:hypothetical protein
MATVTNVFENFDSGKKMRINMPIEWHGLQFHCEDHFAEEDDITRSTVERANSR